MLEHLSTGIVRESAQWGEKEEEKPTEKSSPEPSALATRAHRPAPFDHNLAPAVLLLNINYLLASTLVQTGAS